MKNCNQIICFLCLLFSLYMLYYTEGRWRNCDRIVENLCPGNGLENEHKNSSPLRLPLIFITKKNCWPMDFLVLFCQISDGYAVKKTVNHLIQFLPHGKCGAVGTAGAKRSAGLQAGYRGQCVFCKAKDIPYCIF